MGTTAPMLSTSVRSALFEPLAPPAAPVVDGRGLEGDVRVDEADVEVSVAVPFRRMALRYKNARQWHA